MQIENALGIADQIILFLPRETIVKYGAFSKSILLLLISFLFTAVSFAAEIETPFVLDITSVNKAELGTRIIEFEEKKVLEWSINKTGVSGLWLDLTVDPIQKKLIRFITGSLPGL